MASRLSSFHPPVPVSTVLLKNGINDVPAVDELERLQAELVQAKQRALDRARKAGEDLRTIEESMRRMTEREKGKYKAIEKVKRERDSATPMLDVDEIKGSAAYSGGSLKSRNHSQAASAIPSSSRSSLDPRRSAADELKKKKKKRKREGGDSDVEPDLQRPRKISPPVPPSHPIASKAPKPLISSSLPNNKTISGPDFSVPPTQQLLPERPPIPPPPIPGPSKPTEVTEDFTKTKQPAQQLTIGTFYTSIEPYTRNIKEEDVGFLEYTGDEVEPYVMPKLGRHYLEVWEDQDQGVLPASNILLEPQIAPPSYYNAPTPKWDPSTLSDPDLIVEEKGHGPLTDRVISALLPIPDLSVWKGVKAAEDAMEGRPGGSGAAAARRERLNVTDLEARIRDTMRYHGLLDFVPDFTEKVDDPIAAALRQAQRELRRVVATNKARKSRLTVIARDRLGYQEYLEARDSIDKNITNLYAKLQKKDTPKLSKKKKKPLQGAAAAAAAQAAANRDAAAAAAAAAAGGSVGPEDTAAPALAPCPAALGLTPDEDDRLTVHEQLRQLVETRREWVDQVGSIFDQKEAENPGRIYGLPKESVFKGVEEEIDALLASKRVPDTRRQLNGNVNGTSASIVSSSSTISSASSSTVTTNGVHNNGFGSRGPGGGYYRNTNLVVSNGSLKGKERARSDAMDIG